MIDTKLLLFQYDLKNGLTIDEACQKHDVTLKYAFENLPKAARMPKRIRNRRSNSRQYIIEHHGKYVLRKAIEGKTEYFGRYDKITDAVKVREYCKKHGWRKECIPEYERRCGIKR